MAIDLSPLLRRTLLQDNIGEQECTTAQLLAGSYSVRRSLQFRRLVTATLFVCVRVYVCSRASLFCILDFHGSMRHDTIFTKITIKMQLCRIIYCSFTALHVSSDIFAHHQEHLNCNYRFWFYSFVSLSAAVRSRQQHTGIKPEAVITVKMLLMMSENIARNM